MIVDESRIIIPGWFYRNFDADLTAEVPAQGYGGWQKCDTLPFSKHHSALVVMHAWKLPAPGEFPGWQRVIEYMPRAGKIMREYFPGMLNTFRQAGIQVIHVCGGGNYYQHYPEYQASLSLAGREAAPERIEFDPVRQELDDFRVKNVHPGEHNLADIQKSYPFRDFATEARPLPGEIIVDTTRQLFMQCQRLQISHLVYSGFAINWCLQMSPCCMIEMLRHGLLCSTIRECTTAVENKESAAGELAKALEMWKVALQFGFVYEYNDVLSALSQ